MLGHLNMIWIQKWVLSLFEKWVMGVEDVLICWVIFPLPISCFIWLLQHVSVEHCKE